MLLPNVLTLGDKTFKPSIDEINSVFVYKIWRLPRPRNKWMQSSNLQNYSHDTIPHRLACVYQFHGSGSDSASASGERRSILTISTGSELRGSYGIGAAIAAATKPSKATTRKRIVIVKMRLVRKVKW